MDDKIRISDTDRDQAAARLREHFAAGRLTADELDERLTATLNATTFGEVRGVMADLPGEQAATPGPRGTGRRFTGGPSAWRGRRGPRILPLVLLVVLAVLTLHAGAWVLFGAMRLVLVVWLIAGLAAFVAARRFRRRYHRG